MANKKINVFISSVTFYYIGSILSTTVIKSASISCLNAICKCPFNFDPKCGSNNITYHNKCYIDCHNEKDCNPKIHVIKDGRCSNFKVQWRPSVTPPPTTALTTTRYYSHVCNVTACQCRYGYNPVCASDQVTYSNTCFFRCARRCNHDLNFVKCGLCEWTYPPHRKCLGKTIL